MGKKLAQLLNYIDAAELLDDIDYIKRSYSADMESWIEKTRVQAFDASVALTPAQRDIAMRVHETRELASKAAFDFLCALSAHQYAVDCQQGVLPQYVLETVQEIGESTIHNARAMQWMKEFCLLIDADVSAIVMQASEDLVSRSDKLKYAAILLGRNCAVADKMEAVRMMRHAARDLLKENLAEALKNDDTALVRASDAIADDVCDFARMVLESGYLMAQPSTTKPQGDA